MDETQLAAIITSEVLKKGLGESTWKDKFPEAYEDLLSYAPDMIEHIEKILHHSRSKFNFN